MKHFKDDYIHAPKHSNGSNTIETLCGYVYTRPDYKSRYSAAKEGGPKISYMSHTHVTCPRCRELDIILE